MKKTILFFAISFLGSLSAADAKISEICEQTLQKNLLRQASAVIGYQLNADNVEYSMWYNAPKGKLNLSITSLEDGAHFSFDAVATEQQVKSCSLQPVYDARNSCRYSNYSEIDLDQIDKLVFGMSLDIKNDKKLNNTQKEQIRDLLQYDDQAVSLNDLIADTDDGEVIYQPVTLPTGQELDYYKAYGGDNPFGIFYYQGTLDVAGTNSDGSICISFPK